MELQGKLCEHKLGQYRLHIVNDHLQFQAINETYHSRLWVRPIVRQEVLAHIADGTLKFVDESKGQ